MLRWWVSFPFVGLAVSDVALERIVADLDAQFASGGAGIAFGVFAYVAQAG